MCLLSRARARSSQQQGLQAERPPALRFLCQLPKSLEACQLSTHREKPQPWKLCLAQPGKQIWASACSRCRAQGEAVRDWQRRSQVQGARALDHQSHRPTTRPNQRLTAHPAGPGLLLPQSSQRCLSPKASRVPRLSSSPLNPPFRQLRPGQMKAPCPTLQLRQVRLLQTPWRIRSPAASVSG